MSISEKLPRAQCAGAVLMIRPAAFDYNPETAANGAQLRVDFHKQIKILLDRGGEWINLAWRSPLGGRGLFRRKLDIVLLYSCRSARNFNSMRGSRFHRSPAQIIGGGKTPGAISNYANTNAERLRVRRGANLAILRGKRAAARRSKPDAYPSCPHGPIRTLLRLEDIRLQIAAKRHRPFLAAHSSMDGAHKRTLERTCL